MGQGKAFKTTGTVAGPIAPQPLSTMVRTTEPPLDLLIRAQRLLQQAAVNITADACPPDVVDGIPRSVQDVYDLEEVIKTTEHTKWVLDAAQATALARYAATGQETPGEAFARDERVEYPLGHEAEYTDGDLAPVCDWSVRSTAGRLSSAIGTVTKTPAMHALTLAGDVASWRARAVASELCNVVGPGRGVLEGDSSAWPSWSAPAAPTWRCGSRRGGSTAAGRSVA